jgi:hypothetical protein
MTNQPLLPPPFRLLLLPALLLGVIAVSTKAATNLVDRTPQPDASPVLGSFAEVGKDKKGKTIPFSVQETNGRRVMTAETVPLVIQGTREVTPGNEISAVVRLDNEKAPVSFRIMGGLTGQTIPEGWTLSIGAAAGQDTAALTFRAASQGPREHLARRDYHVRWIAHCGLGVPEDIRKRIDHEIASLPHLREKWLHVRWQVGEKETRLYVDDRLLWAGEAATKGNFSLELSKGTELAMLQVAPLPAAKGPFATVELNGYLNAVQIGGANLKPADQSTVDVSGVPFRLPHADARGNTHIDLSPSWFQAGFTSGRDSPRDGTFGGRWAGAWDVNPGRIQFTLPPGPISAIHLLAAAESTPNSVAAVTAQFYIPDAGRPVQFQSSNVPLLTAPAGTAPGLTFELDKGRTGNFFHITIPVDPGVLSSLGDTFELELTKNVRLYRAYPDPMFYSFHAAGLPSSVHVLALTLERPPVRLSLQADNGLHVWTAPEKPSYIATLTGLQPSKSSIQLEMSTRSYDGLEKTSQKKNLAVAAGEEVKAQFAFDLKKHGCHELTLTLSAGGKVFQTEKRTLALLHTDTREHGNWERGKGPLFGFWNWNGGHNTPMEPVPTRIMALAGAEAHHSTVDDKCPADVKEIMRKYGFKAYKAFGTGDHYITGGFASDLQKNGLEMARTNFLAKLEKAYVKPDEFNRSIFVSFFAEPSVGLYTSGVPTSYDGLSVTNDYTFSEAEEQRFEFYRNGFIEGAKIVKQTYPDVKCLMPHGDPGFPVPFLRRSPELVKLLDGITLDMPFFEKMPEFQLHQIALHRLYILKEEYRKVGITVPWMPMYEGPCLPTRPGSLTPEEVAAFTVRDALMLMAYGNDIQNGGSCPFDAGSYWGEQHYGGGLCDPLPLATPKPAFAAYATMTRHLNRRNFEKWIPTGSLSTYALQFKHSKDGSRVHAFWTIRGKRSVSVAVPPDAKVTVDDSMDNTTALAIKDGNVTFPVDLQPCYVTGLPDAPKIMLGEPDHSDAAPGPNATLLSKLGDGSWKVSEDRDMDYEESFKAFIRRYPARMTVRPAEAPADKSGPALAVHLEKPERECRTMPFYTTLVPRKPLVIPGKASHLGLWVKASSDWGRVVYCLRDARGERWISVGTKGAWNCDDIHAWSYFNFDGWRYLAFELPACSPYDLFREAGTSWWGSYGKGDKIPDLPLALEKILVERRTHAMYVTDPQPALADDVLLGGLFAEYETPEDKTDQAIRLSHLRMPVPSGAAELDNPIRNMETTGVGEATTISGIDVPLQEADGTQCQVKFATRPEAVAYEIWASAYPDGRGAIRLADKAKESPVKARGFIPDTDFYLFVAYTDANKKLSKPSKPFKINLKDLFAMK